MEKREREKKDFFPGKKKKLPLGKKDGEVRHKAKTSSAGAGGGPALFAALLRTVPGTQGSQYTLAHGTGGRKEAFIFQKL